MTIHEALITNVDDIRTKIEELQGLLRCLEYGTEPPATGCSHAGYSHSRLLKTIIMEVVETLENSRKAFRSKELEALRKKLIKVLAEAT